MRMEPPKKKHTVTMDNKPSVNKKRTVHRPGFTLVELLVAVAIALILLSLGVTWAFSAIRGMKANQTQNTMGNVLVLADLLKTKSPVQPDHRLANMYWIQRHDSSLTSPPPAPTGTLRQMSSMEFFVFLSSRINPTGIAIFSQGGSLQDSPFAPGAPAVPVLVDVYEQNPVVNNVLYKAKCPGNYNPQTGAFAAGTATYALVSPPAGYPLKSLFDAWGHELVYRQKTFKGDLNGEDTADVSNSNYTSRHDAEIIVQDEAVAAANGMGPLLPAVAGYAHAMVASAGPDGKWGGFSHPNTTTPGRDASAGNKSSERTLDALDNLYSVEKNQ